MIEIKYNVNNVNEFNYLYDQVGWGSYDIEISKVALKNTIYSVSVDNWVWKNYRRWYCIFVYTRCNGCSKISIKVRKIDY